MKILTVEQMRQIESEADSRGVSYAQMMDDAGAAVAAAITERQLPADTAAVVLVGPGNNGGDGLVAARYLCEAGVVVKIYTLKPVDETDPKVIALRKLSVFIADVEHDVRYHALQQMLKEPTNVIVDALFGTGLKLPLRDNAQKLLAFAKEHYEPSQQWVLAVDCPSGMDCDTGEIDPNALPAQLTITFGAMKIGHFSFPGAKYLGELFTAPIGWGDDLPTWQSVSCELATEERAQQALPARPYDAHKYTFGKTLAIVGSKNYIGAARLVGEAANRIGTGLVTLAVPQSIYPILASQMIETTWLPMPDDWNNIESLSKHIAQSDSVIIGCGLGAEEAAKKLMIAFVDALDVAHNQVPLLVDADGLRLLSQIKDWHNKITKMSVLTPHLGEMNAMSGLSKEEIQKDRLGVARRFAKEWGHIVVLKGAFTVIAAPDGRTVIEPFATSALAKAGAGDVLSGIIGGLLAQKVEPFEAAIAGAYIHGRAGEIAAQQLGTVVSVVASDLFNCISSAIKSLESQ